MIRTDFPRDPSDSAENEGQVNSPFNEVNFPKLFSDVAMSFLEYLELENSTPTPAPVPIVQEPEEISEEPQTMETNFEPKFFESNSSSYMEEDFERSPRVRKERMENDFPPPREPVRVFPTPLQMMAPAPADIYSGLSLRILGVPSKSRVETQLKLCLQLVNNKGANVTNWKYLTLPEHLLLHNKRKDESKVKSELGGSIKVEAGVICSSEHSREVLRCFGCIQRERKSVQRKKKDSDHEPEEPFSVEEEQKKILQFYCSSKVDFSYGEAIIPTRITCYCRHHGEKNGFQIWVTMKDSKTDNVIAAALSSLVMITDDHKSKTTRVKRPRTVDIKQEEEEVLQSNAPLVEKVIPSEGPLTGGIEITILGKDFTPGTRILFGDNESLKTDYWGPTTLLCVLPPATHPATVHVVTKDLTRREEQDEILFTYKDDSDKMMMELALQVVGMKLTGKIHDARQIAMKIVENSNDESFSGGTQQPTLQKSIVGGSTTEDSMVSNQRSSEEYVEEINTPTTLPPFLDSPYTLKSDVKSERNLIQSLNPNSTMMTTTTTTNTIGGSQSINNSLKLYPYFWEDFLPRNGVPTQSVPMPNCRPSPSHRSPMQVRLH